MRIVEEEYKEYGSLHGYFHQRNTKVKNTRPKKKTTKGLNKYFHIQQDSHEALGDYLFQNGWKHVKGSNALLYMYMILVYVS